MRMAYYSLQEQRQKISSNYMELWRTSVLALVVPRNQVLHSRSGWKYWIIMLSEEMLLPNLMVMQKIPQEHVERFRVPRFLNCGEDKLASAVVFHEGLFRNMWRWGQEMRWIMLKSYLWLGEHWLHAPHCAYATWQEKRRNRSCCVLRKNSHQHSSRFEEFVCWR